MMRNEHSKELAWQRFLYYCIMLILMTTATKPSYFNVAQAYEILYRNTLQKLGEFFDSIDRGMDCSLPPLAFSLDRVVSEMDVQNFENKDYAFAVSDMEVTPFAKVKLKGKAGKFAIRVLKREPVGLSSMEFSGYYDKNQTPILPLKAKKEDATFCI